MSTDKEKTNAAAIEQQKEEIKRQLAAQVVEWGSNDEYSLSDYEELDRIYAAIIVDIDPMAMNSRTELTLRTVSRWWLQRDKFLKSPTKDNVSAASNLTSMIEKTLESEQLRKKDKLPTEQVRIDSIIDALERHGFLRNGKILSYNKLVDKIRKDIPRYEYTKDTADQALKHIINCMRANQGMGELPDLPPEYELVSTLDEFTQIESEREKESKQKLGIAKKQRDYSSDLPDSTLDGDFT